MKELLLLYSTDGVTGKETLPSTLLYFVHYADARLALSSFYRNIVDVTIPLPEMYRMVQRSSSRTLKVHHGPFQCCLVGILSALCGWC